MRAMYNLRKTCLLLFLGIVPGVALYSLVDADQSGIVHPEDAVELNNFSREAKNNGNDLAQAIAGKSESIISDQADALSRANSDLENMDNKVKQQNALLSQQVRAQADVEKKLDNAEATLNDSFHTDPANQQVDGTVTTEATLSMAVAFPVVIVGAIGGLLYLWWKAKKSKKQEYAEVAPVISDFRKIAKSLPADIDIDEDAAKEIAAIHAWIKDGRFDLPDVQVLIDKLSVHMSNAIPRTGSDNEEETRQQLNKVKSDLNKFRTRVGTWRLNESEVLRAQDKLNIELRDKMLDRSVSDAAASAPRGSSLSANRGRPVPVGETRAGAEPPASSSAQIEDQPQLRQVAAGDPAGAKPKVAPPVSAAASIESVVGKVKKFLEERSQSGVAPISDRSVMGVFRAQAGLSSEETFYSTEIETLLKDQLKKGASFSDEAEAKLTETLIQKKADDLTRKQKNAAKPSRGQTQADADALVASFQSEMDAVSVLRQKSAHVLAVASEKAVAELNTQLSVAEQDYQKKSQEKAAKAEELKKLKAQRMAERKENVAELKRLDDAINKASVLLTQIEVQERDTAAALDAVRKNREKGLREADAAKAKDERMAAEVQKNRDAAAKRMQREISDAEEKVTGAKTKADDARTKYENVQAELDRKKQAAAEATKNRDKAQAYLNSYTEKFNDKIRATTDAWNESRKSLEAAKARNAPADEIERLEAENLKKQTKQGEAKTSGDQLPELTKVLKDLQERMQASLLEQEKSQKALQPAKEKAADAANELADANKALVAKKNRLHEFLSQPLEPEPEAPAPKEQSSRPTVPAPRVPATPEDAAATKIQAVFRGNRGRQAAAEKKQAVLADVVRENAVSAAKAIEIGLAVEALDAERRGATVTRPSKATPLVDSGNPASEFGEDASPLWDPTKRAPSPAALGGALEPLPAPTSPAVSEAKAQQGFDSEAFRAVQKEISVSLSDLANLDLELSALREKRSSIDVKRFAARRNVLDTSPMLTEAEEAELKLIGDQIDQKSKSSQEKTKLLEEQREKRKLELSRLGLVDLEVAAAVDSLKAQDNLVRTMTARKLAISSPNLSSDEENRQIKNKWDTEVGKAQTEYNKLRDKTKPSQKVFDLLEEKPTLPASYPRYSDPKVSIVPVAQPGGNEASPPRSSVAAPTAEGLAAAAANLRVSVNGEPLVDDPAALLPEDHERIRAAASSEDPVTNAGQQDNSTVPSDDADNNGDLTKRPAAPVNNDSVRRAAPPGDAPSRPTTAQRPVTARPPTPPVDASGRPALPRPATAHSPRVRVS